MDPVRLGIVTDLRRCAGAATALVGLSVSGHVLGGGAPPSLVAAGLVAILATVLGALLASRARPLPVAGLTVVLGAFQAVAHLVFHLVSGHGGLVVASHAASHGAHVPGSTHVVPGVHGLARAAAAGHGARAGGAVPETISTVATHGHALGLSPLMLTSHLLATVLLAWLLGPALRQVRALVRRATPRVPVLTPAVCTPTAFLRPPCLLPRDVLAAVGLRGPPALARA